ncbi:DUF5715 family protein [Paracidobacterium acidisoli]|uniref:Peptidase M15A C-terminal domain-containing protein n=1 Tax=Paracidobacterium acidisoli TaxID=2303751 RepID=A0A372IPD8_9BACT|nr:DUF5715 family protein [Paracidobacterium acidisoli]MBT9331131.1 hypothetical protein [Paracidobacterium acidisoli]
MRSSGFSLVLLLVFASALPASAAVRRHHHRRHSVSHARAVSHVRTTAHHRATETASRSPQTEAKAEMQAAELEPTVPVVTTSIPAYRLTRAGALPPMRGTLASLMRQNERTEADGLKRIQDTAELDELRDDHKLVVVPAVAGLQVNPEIPADRRYCRPWTARFLMDLARAHNTRFRRPLRVNSAVRTVSYQRRLMEINGNAAAATGEIASPHLTGAAVDIGKRGMSFSEIAWMRAWLMPLQAAGRIDVEEEFYQACFHITVYKSYSPAGRVPGHPVRRNQANATLLAAGVH